MTIEDVNKAYDELRAQGSSEEDILGALYLMYKDDKITEDQLGEFIGILGYEFSEEFKAMSEEDKKSVIVCGLKALKGEE
jgi:hypothetical protein